MRCLLFSISGHSASFWFQSWRKIASKIAIFLPGFCIIGVQYGTCLVNLLLCFDTCNMHWLITSSAGLLLSVLRFNCRGNMTRANQTALQKICMQRYFSNTGGRNLPVPLGILCIAIKRRSMLHEICPSYINWDSLWLINQTKISLVSIYLINHLKIIYEECENGTPTTNNGFVYFSHKFESTLSFLRRVEMEAWATP